MPSVLVEIGYLTNQAEEKYLVNEANQEYIASGIFRAFKDYKREIESIND
jgi:N-acetylmuramoyl-L-alanine amidase